MTRVKRSGRELVVDDADVAEYLSQGYSVIDDHGNEIVQGKAIDYASAMKRLAEVVAHDTSVSASLEAANAEIKKLQNEVKKLKSELKKTSESPAK